LQARHTEDELARIDVEAVPMGHNKQEVSVLELYVPAPHAEQLVAPGFIDTVPGEHATQVLLALMLLLACC